MGVHFTRPYTRLNHWIALKWDDTMCFLIVFFFLIGIIKKIFVDFATVLLLCFLATLYVFYDILCLGGFWLPTRDQTRTPHTGR